MPNIRWLLSLITSVHRFLYRATGGWIGHATLGFRFLLLGCTGHKTGLERQIPLLYVKDDDRFVVVASNAGDPRPPAWWTNLRAKPEAWVQAGRERTEVRAREATPEEAEKLWPLLVDAYRWYDTYRERAGRPIPLVLLEPA